MKSCTKLLWHRISLSPSTTKGKCILHITLNLCVYWQCHIKNAFPGAGTDPGGWGTCGSSWQARCSSHCSILLTQIPGAAGSGTSSQVPARTVGLVSGSDLKPAPPSQALRECPSAWQLSLSLTEMDRNGAENKEAYPLTMEKTTQSNFKMM